MADAEVKRRLVAVSEQRMGLAESHRRDWVVNAEVGTTIQDVLDPAYWAYVVKSSSIQLSPYDRIEVRLESGEWVAELMVVNVGMTWASVHLLKLHELSDSAVPVPEPTKFDIQWKGPQRKHAVIRLADGDVVQEGFGQKAEAADWLKNYQRTITMT